jgi:hypothetical protein
MSRFRIAHGEEVRHWLLSGDNRIHWLSSQVGEITIPTPRQLRVVRSTKHVYNHGCCLCQIAVKTYALRLRHYKHNTKIPKNHGYHRCINGGSERRGQLVVSGLLDGSGRKLSLQPLWLAERGTSTQCSNPPSRGASRASRASTSTSTPPAGSDLNGAHGGAEDAARDVGGVCGGAGLGVESGEVGVGVGG